mgnify:CR=1 FL=1
MLNANHSLVVHFDDQIARRNGKMGHGVLRFTANPVVGCIDRNHHGANSRDVLGFGPDCPVVEDVAQALSLGAEVLVLGMAPSGGRLPRQPRQNGEGMRLACSASIPSTLAAVGNVAAAA